MIKEDGVIKFNQNAPTNICIGMLKETNERFKERVENLKEVLGRSDGIVFEKFDNILEGMWDKFVLIAAYASVKIKKLNF